MALFLRGKSTCSICGTVIDEEDDVVAIPAFLKASHRLGAFSDAVFHRSCFRDLPEHSEIERLLAEFRAKMTTAPASIDAYEAWIKNAMKDFE